MTHPEHTEHTTKKAYAVSSVRSGCVTANSRAVHADVLVLIEFKAEHTEHTERLLTHRRAA